MTIGVRSWMGGWTSSTAMIRTVHWSLVWLGAGTDRWILPTGGWAMRRGQDPGRCVRDTEVRRDRRTARQEVWAEWWAETLWDDVTTYVAVYEAHDPSESFYLDA